MADRAGQGRLHGADGARRRALRVRRRGEGLTRAAALALAAALAACAAPAAPPARPPVPPLAEERLPPSGTAEFAVGPIRQTPSPDGRTLFVEGTIRNTGSRPSRDLKVWVNGLDAEGRAIARAEGLPTPQQVPPGTVAAFVVTLPNDPAIRTVHVEAIGR